MRGSMLETNPSAVATAKQVGVLLVDHPSADWTDIRGALGSDRRIACCEARSLEDLRRLLVENTIDVVVSEMAIFGGAELHVLDLVRSAASQASVIIVTAQGDEHWAVEAMKRGAADYLPRNNGYLELLPDRVLAAAAKRGAAATSGAAAHTAVFSQVLNAMPVHFVLVDQRGVIRVANRAWKQFAFESQFQSASFVEGMNYLEVCDAAAERGVKEAREIADGLRRLLAGQLPAFAAEYACWIEDQQRWFKLGASLVRDEHYRGALIAHVEITDRKQAELERDQLFERSMSLLCIGGFDGFIKRWSGAFERTLGYTQDEMMRAPLWEFVHPEDLPQAVKMGAQIFDGQTVATVEMRVRAKDGSYKWIIWDAVPCLEQNVFFATGQDITERKLVEQQLRESHQRFQLLASASNEAVWDWDLRENRLWQNDGYIQAFGQPELDRETVVEWWRRRIHPDDLERILDAMPPALVDGQQKWVLEYRLRRADGGYAYVYDRGFVIFDDSGAPVRMVGSLIDISEMKATEEKLRESEARFRLAAQATRDAIWDWDMQRGEVWRSNGFQTLFGYAAADVANDLLWWQERIHPDERERVLQALPSLETASPQQWSCEYRFRRVDGSYADVFDRGFVLFTPDGRPGRMIGTIMDMSERRHAQEMAQLHQAELAHIARVSTMGEIATGIAHELNQPLTAISNYAESCAMAMAAGSPGAGEKIVGWIDKISHNTHRAAQMIRRLRSFTRKSDPKRSTIPLDELVSEVIELLETEIRRHNVRVRWQRCADVFVTVDRIQIEQVMVNLLRNAYEAMAGMPPERRRITIAARSTAGSKKIELTVADVGEGISGENLERVFDAFFTSKPNGVGIGLAISRSIIEDHGGRMWVTANDGPGVTFHFTLPLSEL